MTLQECLRKVIHCIRSHKLTRFVAPSDIMAIPFEMNSRKDKWLIVYIYKTPF